MGWVYFIGEGAHGPVKIGYALNSVRKRLKTLQTGQARRLVVLLVMEGDMKLEAWLHRICGSERLTGEWFERGPIMCRLLDNLGHAIPDEGRYAEEDRPRKNQSQKPGRVPRDMIVIPPRPIKEKAPPAPRRPRGRPAIEEPRPWQVAGVTRMTWYRWHGPMKASKQPEQSA